jgi:hypothetical protein
LKDKYNKSRNQALNYISVKIESVDRSASESDLEDLNSLEEQNAKLKEQI